MSVPHTIRLRGGKGHRDEFLANGALKPGHLLQMDSSEKVVVHATYGGTSEALFALEDSLQGNLITTAYASSDLVFTYQALPGDIIYARVPAGAVAIVKGDHLISNGDGTLVKATMVGNRQLYANAVVSNTVTNTTVETAYAAAGASLGYTIPAQTAQVGDVFDISVQGIHIGAANTDTFVVKVYLGTTAIFTSPTIDAVTNDIFAIRGQLIVRTIGNSGTFVAGGWVFNGTPSAAAGAADISSGSFVASTTINTNTTNAFTVKVTMSVADTADQSRLDIFNISLGRTSGQKIIAVAHDAQDNSAGSAEAFCPVRILG